MSELDDSFAQLLDRQPTDKERQALYRVRDALQLKTTDAVWLLLTVLQHYETLYEEIPERIADAAREATKEARGTAKAQAKAAHEEALKTWRTRFTGRRWHRRGRRRAPSCSSG